MAFPILVLFMNVGGLNKPIKRQHLRRLCTVQKINVVCFQETHLRDQDIGYLKEIFGILGFPPIQEEL